MKKIFNSILLLLSLPVKVLKKTKIDNFLGGLIFGAIFSMLVNILTVQLQEIIQKQRILEAIENEIMTNMLTAREVIEYNQEQIDSDARFNPYHVVRKYSRDLWEQSAEPLQYIAQLDQETQIALNGYYTITVPIFNGELSNIENLTNYKLLACFDAEKTEQIDYGETCTKWSSARYQMEIYPAQQMSKSAYDVLQKFHPTEDRLNNWLLRLILGDKSTVILSGK